MSTTTLSISRLMPPSEVSEVTGFSVGTLNVMRARGTSPFPWVKRGRMVMYRAEDIAAYIESLPVCGKKVDGGPAAE